MDFDKIKLVNLQKTKLTLFGRWHEYQ